MLRVQVRASDNGGCGHYRCLWPAAAVAAAGLHDIDLVPFDDPRAALQMQCRDQLYAADTGEVIREREVVDIADDIDADVVVLQRPLHMDIVDAIPVLQRRGIAVVVEVDDDFTAIHPRNAAYPWCHPDAHPERNWRHLLRACQMADLVTVSTPALAARFGRHGRVAVVPNYLPPSFGAVDREKEEQGLGKIRVGWSGTVESHPTDLQQTGGAIARVARDCPEVELVCVGTGVGVARALGVESVRASGWVEIDHYPNAMAQIDVGIVPLDLSPFNEAKSWLKGLEFAACGRPFVATPTEQYRSLADAGIGWLAKNGVQWERRVRQLVTDRQLREDLGEVWRAKALAHFTLSRHADVWADAWTLARENATQRALRLAVR